jgi:hypothetical protein
MPTLAAAIDLSDSEERSGYQKKFVLINSGWYINQYCRHLEISDSEAFDWNLSTLTQESRTHFSPDEIKAMQQKSLIGARKLYESCGDKTSDFVKYASNKVSSINKELFDKVYSPLPKKEVRLLDYQTKLVAFLHAKECGYFTEVNTKNFAKMIDTTYSVLLNNFGKKIVNKAKSEAIDGEIDCEAYPKAKALRYFNKTKLDLGIPS